MSAARAPGWTDADADAARLALELECLLTDRDSPMPLVSRWWDSAHEALELHRQRMAALPQPEQDDAFGCVACATCGAPAPAQAEPVAWLFTCKKPGTTSQFASIAPDGTEEWPWDQWKTVTRESLGVIGPREQFWPRPAAPQPAPAPAKDKP